MNAPNITDSPDAPLAVRSGDLLADTPELIKIIREWAYDMNQNLHPVTLTLYAAANKIEAMASEIKRLNEKMSG